MAARRPKKLCSTSKRIWSRRSAKSKRLCSAACLERRNLARLLGLPQDVTPTAATPPRPLGLWEPSLQESIVAAYNYSEELDQLILDISINNSQANASLAAVQPVLRFVNSTSASRSEGQSGQTSWSEIDMGDFTYGAVSYTHLTLPTICSV